MFLATGLICGLHASGVPSDCMGGQRMLPFNTLNECQKFIFDKKNGPALPNGAYLSDRTCVFVKPGKES